MSLMWAENVPENLLSCRI